MNAVAVDVPARPRRARRVIPGLGLTLGFSVAYLSLVVLIPLAGVFLKSAGLGWEKLWEVWSDPRVIHALQLSFGASLAAAMINAVMGTWVAWVLVRYEFPGRKINKGMYLPHS